MGLSLAYALPITDRLNGILTVSAETEQEMVAVERLAEYTKRQHQPLVLPPVSTSQGTGFTRDMQGIQTHHCCPRSSANNQNQLCCLGAPILLLNHVSFSPDSTHHMAISISAPLVSSAATDPGTD